VSDAAPDDAEATEAAPEPLTVHGAPAEEVRGVTVVHVDAERYEALIKALYDEGFTFCTDLCAVDHLVNATRVVLDGVTPARFEVVLTLRDMPRHKQIRIRCQVAGDPPRLASLFGVYPGTEAMEREAYDLFGIVFSGHPDLTRILLPEDWEGHPLRKDSAHGKVPVQFKAPQSARHV
jgi:NADH-quinone oxidoreductase subunit C